MRDYTPRDNFSSDDIGRIVGATLVNPLAAVSRHVIYLLGPSMLHEETMAKAAKRNIGRDTIIHLHGPEKMTAFPY